MTLIDLNSSEYIEIYNEIRKSYLEQLGYQNIIIYMINNNMRNSESYKIYFKEYIEALGKYEIIK